MEVNQQPLPFSLLHKFLSRGHEIRVHAGVSYITPDVGLDYAQCDHFFLLCVTQNTPKYSGSSLTQSSTVEVRDDLDYGGLGCYSKYEGSLIPPKDIPLRVSHTSPSVAYALTASRM
ncbi:MAG: hypothetical protein DDT24_00248 [Chloroflexi bacterium]|nr:hypothetical protein [Chloroflexota bacterium]